MAKLAVILFPGTNCENETARAIEAVGMKADILRWNDTAKLKEYDGYVLPGGWSYEDRIRAGVISAKDPIMLAIKDEAKRGKVVLGICNGCQILGESGIIPYMDRVQLALAPNCNPFVSGYYCTWVHMTSYSKKKNAFNKFIEQGDVLAISIAHGEGRFTTKDPALVNQMMQNEQLQFRYCDSDGSIKDSFPINPNGSMINIAGITNKEGNVLAMMPHPERALAMRQVPGMHHLGEQAGPGYKIFQSIKEYLR